MSEKQCNDCNRFMNLYDEDGDENPIYCEGCGGFWRQQAEEVLDKLEHAYNLIKIHTDMKVSDITYDYENFWK